MWRTDPELEWQKMHDGDALSAELWACLQGLKVAWDEGCRRVILDSDSTCAIQMISKGAKEEHIDYALVKEIQATLARDWVVRMEHTDRRHNEAADFLAKRGPCPPSCLKFQN